MFYSHNLLARKGPLGTVWCAAHLQNKLKKSNYITINIPSTVEKIMNPDVPIALRMSGHLLLGVVRIYSKKVEYLQHDYNVLRIDINKAYTYVDINLPEDANQAPYESITLPDSFELDALNLDDYNLDGSPDNHLRNQEDISLADHSPASLSKVKDRIPAGYVLISLSEDLPSNPSRSEDDSGSRAMPMEEDSSNLNPPETTDAIQDPGPSNHREFNDNLRDDDSELPIENLREVVRDDDLHGFPPILPEREEPDRVLEEMLKENSSGTSNREEPHRDLEEISVPHGESLPSKQNKSLDSAPTEPALDCSDPHISFGLASPDMAVQPSPAVQPAPAAEQPRARRRRRFYDENTVLTNGFMKKALNDPSNLLRKRKGVYSSLGIWKLNNKRKKEQVLVDPIMTGLCENLREIFEKDCISGKPHLVAIEETHPEDDMEIERPRNFVGSTENNTNLMHSPDNVMHINSPDNRSFSSQPRMADSTPAISTGIGSKSYQPETDFGTGTEQTPMPSAGSFLPEMETPIPESNEHPGFDNSGLSDIPEMENSGELTFLEDDETTQAGLRGTPQSDYSSGKTRPLPEINSLSARTRAVARYISEKSSATPSTSENASGDLSLNSILEGKRRKVCARMFFETLVLKSCDLVDVKQDEAYGDITVKVTPKLSKGKFSS